MKPFAKLFEFPGGYQLLVQAAYVTKPGAEGVTVALTHEYKSEKKRDKSFADFSAESAEEMALNSLRLFNPTFQFPAP